MKNWTDIRSQWAFQSSDLQACQVQFDLATDSEIPIVTFDSGSDYQGVAADVSTDNVAAGKEAAQRLAEEMGRQRRSGAVDSGFQSQAALQREKAVTEELKANHPNISVVNVYHMDELSNMQKTVSDEIMPEPTDQKTVNFRRNSLQEKML